MSTLKNILIHVSVETAKRDRTCKGKSPHSNKTIGKGKNCLRVKTGKFTSSIYCEDCASKMLDEAEKNITILKSKF
jgi:hypothetical protein